MLRRLVAGALLAGTTLALTPAAHAVKDCDTAPCYCGTEIAVGLPGKDPIVSLGRIDC